MPVTVITQEADFSGGGPGAQGPPGPPVAMMEAGVALPARASLNFAAGFDVTDNAVDDRVDVSVPVSPGGGGGGVSNLLSLTDVDPTSVGVREDAYWDTTTGTLKFSPAGTVHIGKFGGKGDGVHLTDAAMTGGSATLTSASAPFTALDVNKVVVVLGAGTGTPANGKGFTIQSYQSPTQVTLSGTASVTVSGAQAFFGTDNYAAYVAAFAALTNGGEIAHDGGFYMVGTMVVVPGGFTLSGPGYTYAGDGSSYGTPTRGAVIIGAGAITTAVVKLGDMLANAPVTDISYSSLHTAPKLKGIIVYGANVVTSAVYVVAARWRIDYCELRSGMTQALLMSGGQNGICADCIIAQHSRGTCVTSAGSDNKYYRNQIRGFKTAGLTQTGGHAEIVDNHAFSDTADDSTAGPCFVISGSGVTFRGNIMGTNNLRSPDLRITAQAGGGTFDISIADNQFYKATATDALIPAIHIDTTLGPVDQLSISDNHVRGYGGVNKGYKNIVDVTGANVVTGWAMNGNNASGVYAFVTAASGQAPGVHVGNIRRADIGSGFVETTF